MFAETVTVSVPDSPVEEPLIGFRLSQAALSLTDQRRSPPPEFHIFRV
jgi:hypothetical protein